MENAVQRNDPWLMGFGFGMLLGASICLFTLGEFGWTQDGKLEWFPKGCIIEEGPCALR